MDHLETLLSDDGRRLGVRRVTPSRRWFSTFTVALVAHHQRQLRDAAPVETGWPRAAVPASISPERLDAQFSLIDELGPVPDDPETKNLRDLCRHFRSRLLREEGPDIGPPLQAVWAGYGSSEIRRLGPRHARHTMLRVYNAADLGTQGVIEFEHRGWGLGSRPDPVRLALLAVGPAPPTTAEVEALLSESGPPPPATRRTTPLLNDLLDFAATRSPLAATDQDLVDVLHAHGQQAARTLGTALVALGDARVVLGPEPAAVRRRQAWVTDAPSIDFSIGDRHLAPV
ncbi:MAG: hypothetical protein ACRBI6_19100 [Acidimicrobiales bacterium]